LGTSDATDVLDDNGTDRSGWPKAMSERPNSKVFGRESNGTNLGV
jgi:hypothetical protein